MATVNITADMNADEVVTIADATAEAGIHLFQFFTDDKNMFNIASQAISGAAAEEVVVTVDTNYVFTISAEQAQLLNGAASTYEHYLLDGNGGKVLKNEGSVTVTPLSGTSLPVLEPFLNGDRVLSTSAALILTREHDIIIGTPAAAVQYTLQDAQKMIGKRYDIYLAGVGSITVKTPDTAELVTLATAGDCCHLIAIGNGDADDWHVFYPYIQP